MAIGFKEAKAAAELALMSGTTPILVGERGIGKTSLARLIAKENDWGFVWIDGNLLKEGEIGGLPTVVGQQDASVASTAVSGATKDAIDKMQAFARKVYGATKESNKELADVAAAIYRDVKAIKDGGSSSAAESNAEGATITNLQTKYAIHHKLAEVLRLHAENPNRPILLFLDELNRCEHAVQQELMNLVLNREINGLVLPDNVYVMAAENPSSKFAEFKDTTYQTVDMDEAQEDRFVWIVVESDEKSWLDWALQVRNEEAGDTNVHPDVAEFIGSNPDFLNQPRSTDDVKPSPRSWERVSKSYATWLKYKKKFTPQAFYNVIKGNVGQTAAISFRQFINENSNPLPKPEEIFANVAKSDRLSDAIKKRIFGESFPRMLIITKNCIRFMLGTKKTKNMLGAFSEIVVNLPKDLMVMVMMSILHDHRDLHNKLVEIDEYLNAFHNTDALVD